MQQRELGSPLQMALLGSPRVLLGSEPVTGFRTSKGRALLFYLALSGRVQQRARLTALFWPEADEVHARASLRTALADLRTLLGEHLAITRETVALRPDGLWLDVAQFDALLRRTGDAQTDIMQLEAAVALYRGDFLEGFHTPDAPEFEQWATIERERLRQAVLNGLLALAEWHMAQGDFAAGLEDLNRLLAIDPVNESGHRQKMIALARLDQRTAALQQYDVCRRVLAEELGVDPSSETTAVYELILAGALETQPWPASEVSRGEKAPSRPQPVAAAPRPPRMDRRGMPERTPFYGCQEDLAELSRWLAAGGARGGGGPGPIQGDRAPVRPADRA